MSTYNSLKKLSTENFLNNNKCNFYLVLLMIFYSLSCNTPIDKQIDIHKYNDSISNQFIAFNKVNNNTKEYRSISFMTDDEEYPIPIQGRLYSKNSAIWISLDHPNLDTFKLFDFKFRTKESETISWQISGYGNEPDTLIQKRHTLILQNKFYDEGLKDSIYHFRLDSIGMFGTDDNIVCFVSKKHWIVGFYISEFYMENDSIIEIAIPSYGNIYKKKIDYSNVDFNHVLK